MSDGIDMEGAIEAFSATLPDEVELDAQVSEPVVEDNQPEHVTEAEPFTAFDPSALPEDMQAVYRSMQGDYTRKTQEIAELRRQYEAFSEAEVDPEVALQAVGFLQELNSNPEFAMHVAEQIRQTMGTPDDSQSSNVAPSDNNDNSYDGLPPELAAELQEMRAWRQEMMTMQAQQESMAEIGAMENTIRTANPHYSDDDIEAIYSLGYSTDGDLLAAQELYAGIQQRLLGNYLQSKQVPHGATPAPSAPSSVPNRSFANLDEAHAAAMEAIRNIS